MDLRTQKQKARDFEHNKIVNMYLQYKSDPNNAKVSDHRIFEAIAKDPNVSVSTYCGVRNILIAAGVYQTKR